MKLLKGKKYHVTWIDAAGEAGWTAEDQIDKFIKDYEQPIEQELFFVKESKQSYLFTSQTGDRNGMYCDLHLIPKAWCKIKRIKQ
jgi:hypothetical protein